MQQLIHRLFGTIAFLVPSLHHGAEHVVRRLEIALVADRSICLGQIQVDMDFLRVVQNLVEIISIG